jgi:two-component system OmpR family sensor kinase
MSEGPGARAWSLERRIHRRMLGVLGGLWLAGSVITLVGLWHETGGVLDAALHETAERFLLLPEAALGDARGTGMYAEVGADKEHVIYQVFDARGRLRLRSHAAPETALYGGKADGMRDIKGWHVLSLTRADGRRRVEVAESIEHRYEVLWKSLGWLAGTLLLLLPAASVSLTIIVRDGFHGLDWARAELATRNTEDLRQLEETDAPQELQPWIASVNSLLARLRQLVDAERSMAAHTAHELRTPLAAARAKAQRLALMSKDEQTRQNALDLVRRLDRITRFATRLMQLARIQSGATLRREPVDLAMVARMLLEEFSESVAWGRLRLEVGSGPVTIVGDLDAVAIALRNLIDNALKHGGKDSWLSIVVENGTILVVDDGPGVPAESLHKLVRPFERGMTAAEGSGLGLSITDAIVRHAGGSLEFRSPILAGRGFAAVLRFPLAQVAAGGAPQAGRVPASAARARAA